MAKNYYNLILSFFAFFSVTLVTNANPSSLAFSDLKSETESLLQSGDLVTAIPYLEEMINRTEALEGDNARQPLEALYFFTARGYMMQNASTGQQGDLKKALEYFDKYEKDFSKESRYTEVLMSRADCYRVLGDFKSAIIPLSELVMKRGNPYRYDEDFYQTVLQKIVEAYYILQDWDGGEKWFKKLLEESPSDVERTRAAAALVESYLNRGNIEDTIKLLPVLLTESPTRYSLGLNVALLKAGNSMRDKGKYEQASLFYSLTLTPEEMLIYHEKRIKMLKKQLEFFQQKRRQNKIDEYELAIFNSEQTIESLKSVESYGPDLEILKARIYFDTSRIYEAFYAHKKIVEKYPKHDAIEDFIFATIAGANQIGKPELAMDLGRQYLDNSSYTKFRQDVAMMMMQVYQKNEDYDRFFTLGNDFVRQFSDKEEGSVVVYLMGNTWLQLNELDTLTRTFKDYISKFPNAPWLDGCYYWVGLASVYQGDFKTGKAHFEPLVEKYPYSSYHEDGMYRYAVCVYGVGEIEPAIKSFNEFNEKYSSSNLRGESEYFLGEIYAAKGDLDNAFNHYKEVDLYTDNASYIKNAYFQAGELYFKNKRYEEMAENFKTFLDKYPESPHFTDAIFELGRAKELLGKPGEMQKDYMEAIIQYGNYPESRGVDKLLEVFVEKYHTTRTKLEKTIEFLNKCLSDDEFCQKFIDDKGYLYEYFLANKGIDGEIEMKFRTDEKFESIDTIKNPLKSILEAYNMQYDVFPKTTPEELFKPAFEQAWKAKKYTLAYRLQMALEQKGIIVNSSKVFTRDDFELASPKLLVWMAQKSAKSDPDMAREANLKVIDEYSDSPFVLEALVTMAKIEEQEKDYAKALVYYEKASQQFYDDPMAPKIVIKIGDLWRAQRQFEKARDQYQTILKTPSWRTGPLQAEALYHIGLSYFDEGLFKEAHGFFERVFVGHSFFASWAIKAYMMDAKTLVKMGALADAKNTLKECLANDSFKSDPQYLEAQELYNNL